jgi:hypothetical protein
VFRIALAAEAGSVQSVVDRSRVSIHTISMPTLCFASILESEICGILFWRFSS